MLSSVESPPSSQSIRGRQSSPVCTPLPNAVLSLSMISPPSIVTPTGVTAACDSAATAVTAPSSSGELAGPPSSPAQNSPRGADSPTALSLSAARSLRLDNKDFRRFSWKLTPDLLCDHALSPGQSINHKEVTNFVKLDPRLSRSQQCVMCGRSDVAIPSQNKNVCKHCDSCFWLHLQWKVVMKFCKGCKNFFALEEFAEKVEGTKCQKCRKRGRENYLSKKQVNVHSPMVPPSLQRCESGCESVCSQSPSLASDAMMDDARSAQSSPASMFFDVFPLESDGSIPHVASDHDLKTAESGASSAAGSATTGLLSGTGLSSLLGVAVSSLDSKLDFSSDFRKEDTPMGLSMRSEPKFMIHSTNSLSALLFASQDLCRMSEPLSARGSKPPRMPRPMSSFSSVHQSTQNASAHHLVTPLPSSSSSSSAWARSSVFSSPEDKANSSAQHGTSPMSGSTLFSSSASVLAAVTPSPLAQRPVHNVHSDGELFTPTDMPARKFVRGRSESFDYSSHLHSVMSGEVEEDDNVWGSSKRRRKDVLPPATPFHDSAAQVIHRSPPADSASIKIELQTPLTASENQKQESKDLLQWQWDPSANPLMQLAMLTEHTSP